ncbi:MAG: hypothetical protein RML35_00660 [Chloroherpetonaceae bacterium]|nr:hypothetical protein [Chloroherpetonaceae bacterium]
MKKYHKKKFKKTLEKKKAKSGYQMLLGYYFETTPQVLIPVLRHYEDLWTQHLIGADMRHSQGAIRYDWRIEYELQSAKKNDKMHTDFFKENRNRFPLYYRGVPKREFVIAEGNYRIKLNMDSRLLSLLQEAIQENNSGYLGTSEGWVDISIEEVKNV